MPLDSRADESFHRISPPGQQVQALLDEVALLRRGLQQIATGDYPAEAGSAETWAEEILHDTQAVNWEEYELSEPDREEEGSL